MTLHTWWIFLVAVFLLSGTPGPNMLHVLSRSVTFGLRRSVAAMAGCLTGLLLVLIASAAGLAAVLMASPTVFDVLRYTGVAYLIWVGIKAWRAGEAPVDIGDDSLDRSMSAPKLFTNAFVIGISNPKLLMFAAAFLPQFIDKTTPEGPQFAILIATFAVVEMFWYLVYGMGGRSLARHLARPALKRLFNRVTGVIFVGFGLALLKARPA